MANTEDPNDPQIGFPLEQLTINVIPRSGHVPGSARTIEIELFAGGFAERRSIRLESVCTMSEFSRLMKDATMALGRHFANLHHRAVVQRRIEHDFNGDPEMAINMLLDRHYGKDAGLKD